MPPKTKYSREEIAGAAFEMIQREGVTALTARALADRLHTSVSPIFTAFVNMDDLKLAARELALAQFRSSIQDFQDYTPAFKRIGMMVVSWGIHEPELFKLLFMQEHTESRSFRDALDDLGDFSAICMDLIRRDYSLEPEDAQLLLEQMWTQAFGLGTMCAMRVCTLSEEEIGKRLSIMFAGLVSFIRSGNRDRIFADTEKNTDGLYHGIPVQDIPF